VTEFSAKKAVLAFKHLDLFRFARGKAKKMGSRKFAEYLG
jgi:hypothetical protein